jgi:AraC family transcriptional regulator, regulatory protein of adaptative response / methylphosphotriester-DNA alkyltransferase methyltransferase
MPAKPIPKKILARQHEITADFMQAVHRHLDDVVQGKVMDMYEIRDFADELHIHPTHLSNTIKLVTGKAPCFFVEARILEMAKTMLADASVSIAQVAATLTFDPSNFTKFFKRFAGMTPKQYREEVLMQQYAQKTETVTI